RTRILKNRFLREQVSGHVQSEKDQMNYSILADIELNRKISLFQKAVEAYVLNRTLENSMALAKAKADLAAFVLRGV
ncbi:hypothetical protein KR654_19780, partial [Acinetobacter baumannii]|nr:hypothetical protein [Acinetobacter baumannii]